VLLIVLLLAAGWGVRWMFVKAVVFPPLDDPAFYLTTAKNLVSGRGLVVDTLWSYQPYLSSVTHPSHEHWMPLPTGLIAAAFVLQRAISGVLETSLRVAQLPGMILATLLAPLTYIVGRRILPGRHRNRWMALTAGLLIAANAALGYQSASADSSAPYAFLAAWALATAVRRPGDEAGYFGTGLLIALAYLTRADGLMLLVTVPLAWWLLPVPAPAVIAMAKSEWATSPPEDEEEWPDEFGPTLANFPDILVAFTFLVAIWLVRNYVQFGTPLPSSVLDQLWLRDYWDTFSYSSRPGWETWLAQGWQALLKQRIGALLHNSRVFLVNTFPWGLLALPGVWFLRERRTFYPPVVYGLCLFFVTAIVFPVSSTYGTFYHSLGAVMPFLALAAAYAVYRFAQRISRNRRMVLPLFGAFAAGLLIVAGGHVGLFALPRVAERHQAEKEQFEAAAAWLAANAAPGDVVMTTQPYTLNYVSGHPCIVLPGNEPPDIAWEAAERFRARFLIITQRFGLYPQVLNEQPDPRFRLLETTDGNEIYEIVQD
jgi:hypothetical protein